MNIRVREALEGGTVFQSVLVRPYSRAVIGAETFPVLLSALRFDHPVKSNEGKQKDPTETISLLFNIFI